MALGDITEMLNTSMYGDEVQVYCSWQETGTRISPSRGEIPTYSLVGIRVINGTDAPVGLELYAPDGTVYDYQVAPVPDPGTTFALTSDQLAKLADGVSVSVTGTPLPTA